MDRGEGEHSLLEGKRDGGCLREGAIELGAGHYKQHYLLLFVPYLIRPSFLRCHGDRLPHIVTSDGRQIRLLPVKAEVVP